jgi:hypothetical protein
MFRYADRCETAGPGTTVFVRAGTAHTYTAAENSRYLIVLTPRLRALTHVRHDIDSLRLF